MSAYQYKPILDKPPSSFVHVSQPYVNTGNKILPRGYLIGIIFNQYAFQHIIKLTYNKFSFLEVFLHSFNDNFILWWQYSYPFFLIPFILFILDYTIQPVLLLNYFQNYFSLSWHAYFPFKWVSCIPHVSSFASSISHKMNWFLHSINVGIWNKLLKFSQLYMWLGI